MKLVELLEDSKFETGFHVLGINPVKDKRNFEVFLDYGNKAKPTSRVVWQMAQWWTNFPLKNATFTDKLNSYLYETKSRSIEVTPFKGKLQMNLDSSLEYKEKMRLSHDEPWSHLLIEQDFNSSYDLSQMNKLFINLK